MKKRMTEEMSFGEQRETQLKTARELIKRAYRAMFRISAMELSPDMAVIEDLEAVYSKLSASIELM